MSIFVKHIHILNDRKYDSRGILTVGHQRTQIFDWAKENKITLQEYKNLINDAKKLGVSL